MEEAEDLTLSSRSYNVTRSRKTKAASKQQEENKAVGDRDVTLGGEERELHYRPRCKQSAERRRMRQRGREPRTTGRRGRLGRQGDAQGPGAPREALP